MLDRALAHGTLWPEARLFHYRTKHGAEVDFVLDGISAVQGPEPESISFLPVCSDVGLELGLMEQLAGDPSRQEWIEEFEAAARRSLETRFRYAFIHTYKPVLDDASYRAFDSTAAYRDWCEAHLPSWLGYGRV